MLDLKVPLVLAGIKGFDAGGSGFLDCADKGWGRGSIQLCQNLTPIYADDTDQNRPKLRLGGGMGEEAGFSATLLAKARAVRFANAHLSDDKVVAKMGHPIVAAGA